MGTDGRDSYLLLSSPIAGHVAPVKAIGAALAVQGHRVRMLTGARFQGELERAGIEFAPWPRDVDFDDRCPEESFPARNGLTGVRALRFDTANVFARPARRQFGAIATALADEPTDALVAEFGVMGVLPLLLGDAPRPPVHVVGVGPMMLSSVDTFPFGPGRQPPTGPLGRLAARGARHLIEKLVLAPGQRIVDEQLNGLGLDSSPVFVLEWYRLADRYWQLTIPGFEYPRRDLPVNVRFAGPILPATKRELPDWWADLDGCRPIVHVTQGTIDNRDLSKLLEPTVAGLAGEDVLVVCSTGGRPVTAIQMPIPDNARIAEMLPYDALLPRVAVMVTNGGYGGVQFALAHSVPVVIAGDTEDKAEIAARIAFTGTGINVGTDRPTPQRIATAVHEVLNAPQYRTATEKLADQASTMDAITTITDELTATTSANQTDHRRRRTNAQAHAIVDGAL